MTDLANVQNELHDITARLTDAVEKLNNGITLDLSDLAPRAKAVCEQILQLPPDEAMGLLAELQATVERLDALHARVKSS